MDLREMTEEQRNETLQALSYYLKGDQGALRFCLDLLYLAHLWDDIYDQDKERTPAEISHGFQIALGELPHNSFFEAFRPQLSMSILMSMFMWQDSNQLATGNNDHKLAAFALRNFLLTVIYSCMFLVPGGGFEWIAQEGINFWRSFSGGLHDKYMEYLKEYDHA